MAPSSAISGVPPQFDELVATATARDPADRFADAHRYFLEARVGETDAATIAQIDEALAWVGLTERAHHRPYELSGGEQQRVAIARAVAETCALVLADEPTGQLDTRTGRRVLDLLRRLVEEKGVSLLIVTHDPQVMAEADVVHEMRDGQLIETRIKNGVAVPGL